MSYTKISHRATYAAIDPTRPELSAAGKVVFVTGGGSGIGKAMALRFAEAGSRSIALFGRREGALAASAEELKAAYPDIKVFTQAVSVVDPAAVDAAFDGAKKALGPIDILVHAAATIGNFGSVSSLDVKVVLETLNTNVGGTLAVAQALLKNSSASPVFVNVTAGFIAFPTVPGIGDYLVSKLSSVKLLEYVASENENLRIVNMHPGVIQTDMAQAVVDNTVIPLEFDEESLPATFAVWAASEEAAFLKNKTVWANWDVEELIARKEEIQGSRELQIVINGI